MSTLVVTPQVDPEALQARISRFREVDNQIVQQVRRVIVGQEEVIEQVRQRLKIFGAGGGFVFNPVHNVQARAPIENILAMYRTVREFRHYPLQ